jgi:hypothetical protein
MPYHVVIDMSKNAAQEESSVKSAKRQMTVEGHQPVGSGMAAGWCKPAPIGGELMANRKQNHMWWTVAVILIILWLPGLLGGHTVGGIIRILLPLALVVVLLRIIQGRRPA